MNKPTAHDEVNELLSGVSAETHVEREYRFQAEFVARLATAIAEGKIPEGQRWVAARKLHEAADTLRMWTRDDRPGR